jgi:hypothetical protein
MKEPSDRARTGRTSSGLPLRPNYFTPTRTEYVGWTPSVLAERTLHRRAVEAAIWGIPLVNFDAIRQAYFRDAGAAYGDVLYWSKPPNWKFQAPTPNSSAHYVIFFANLRDGPVVVDVPPADEASLFGSIVDAWNLPLVDMGNEGEDKGKGGQYVVLPPDNHTQPPTGATTVQSSTYNVYGSLRVTPRTRSADDIAKAISYLKRLRVGSVTRNASSRPPRFIDMADKQFEGIPSYDERFYASLARMVFEEPVKERDLSILGQMRTLGIGKDVKYQPSATVISTLMRAVAEAHAYLAQGWRHAGFEWWPERSWKFLSGKEAMRSGGTFLREGRVLLDERGFNFFGAFGMNRVGPPILSLETFEDGSGKSLDGTCTYRLRIPANVPTTDLWSVAAYDADTAAFIREAPVVGLDSSGPMLRKNPDGSVDVYFAPRPPDGHASNWIATSDDRPFFVVFRNHAPDGSVFARTSRWKLGELEEVELDGGEPDDLSK